MQKRMDGCPPAAIPEFSFAKAYTCISMGLSSRAFRDKYTADAADPGKYCQMLSMVNITGGKMAPFPVSESLRALADALILRPCLCQHDQAAECRAECCAYLRSRRRVLVTVVRPLPTLLKTDRRHLLCLPVRLRV